MKNLLLYGNCQMHGIKCFLEMSPDMRDFKIEVFETWRMVVKLETEERENRLVENADIVFYHAHSERQLNKDKLKQGTNSFPSSVFYNSGPFIGSASEEDFAPVMKCYRESGINNAVIRGINEFDLGYSRRWKSNYEKMCEKEIDNDVPQELRITDLYEHARNVRMVLTDNHPTSYTFFHWTNRVLCFLKKPPLSGAVLDRCMREENITGLPCYSWITPVAKNVLGLKYGGTETDKSHNADEIKEKIKAFEKAGL